jgi:hypothetical protein
MTTTAMTPILERFSAGAWRRALAESPEVSELVAATPQWEMLTEEASALLEFVATWQREMPAWLLVEESLQSH